VSRHSSAERAARDERVSKTRHCRRCDPCGWLLDTDGTPVDPAVRCQHGARPPVCRDISEPIHQQEIEL